MTSKIARARLTRLALAAALLATGLGTTASSLARQATPAPGAADCPAPLDAGAAGAVSAPPLPEGVSFDLLASMVADRLPAPPVSLILTRLDLAPAAGSETRLAIGPLLFFVESGSIVMYVDGVEFAGGPGSVIAAPMDALYAFANVSSSPASVLRVALAPATGADGPIMVVPTSMPTLEQTPAIAPVSAALVRAELAIPPPAGHRLFLACLAWTGAAPSQAALEGRSSAGPVGLWVQAGQALVDDALTLDAGGCNLLAANAPHRLAAGATPALVLLFGVIPDGSPILTDAAATGGAHPAPASLRCGEN